MSSTNGAPAAEEGKAFASFAPEAAAALLGYSWPGNVRELQNVIRRVVVMNDGERVEFEMLPAALRGAEPSAVEPALPAGETLGAAAPAVAASGDGDEWVPDGLSLADIERLVIETTIARCDGRVPEAARRLGVSPSTLYRKRAAWSEDQQQ